MKATLTILLFSTISTFSFAGPEDRPDETCYSATKDVPTNVPSFFCFNYLELDSEKKFLYSSGINSNLPNNMRVTSVIFRTEDKVKFEANETLVNVWESGCGDGIRATLTIKGESDITAMKTIDPTELKLSVELEQTNDTCHSIPQPETIEYILTK